MKRRIFHIMMGRDGGTEQFFLRLTRGFHEAGLEQEFAVRPNQTWLDELAPRGRVHQGTYLRRDPLSLLRLWGLHRQIARVQPDVVMAWRAPVVRLIPQGPWSKIVRLGDFPFNIKYFKKLDGVVANTPDIVTHIRAQGWQGRAEVISNFPPAKVTPELLTSEDDYKSADGTRVLAYGRFVESKGFDTLIKAMVFAPDATLTLLGDGPLRQDLINLAASIGVSDRIAFLGWQSDLTDYLNKADIMVLPSRDEPLGNVILEAWGADLPVVATRSQGPTWFGADGINMDLVDIDDAQAMGAAIARLVREPARRVQLAEGGAKTLSSQFSQETVIASYMKLFDQISDEKGAL